MEEPGKARRISWPVLVAILAVVVAVGAALSIWSYLASKKERVRETDLYSMQESLLKQANRLEEQERINRELAARLSAMQESRREMEAELAETREDLSGTEQRLAGTRTDLAVLREQDWETRYGRAVRENELLAGKLASLEFQHSLAREELAKMERSNGLLADRIRAMADKNSFLELERDDLARSYDQLREKYLDSLAQSESMVQALVEELARAESYLGRRERRITQLEETVQQNERIMAGLKAEIDSYETVIAQIQQDLYAPAAPAESSGEVEIIVGESAAVKPAPGDNYRYTRLQSLARAMEGRGSADRKQILVNVIPTVPGGISGKELATLITGMNSADILSVIEMTRRYISRPLDDKSLSILFSNMSRNDADMASLILAGDSQELIKQ